MRPRTSILFLPLVFGLAGCGGRAVAPEVPCADTRSVAERLTDAYVHRDYPAFAALLHPDYRFVYDAPDPETGATGHGRIEELRLHQRLFLPQNTPPGDPPWPPSLWATSITVVLSLLQAEFVERHDLYRSPDNPGGLDRERWLVLEAQHASNFFVETQGETDYQVNGRDNLVVARDLAAAACEPQLFLYRWEDLSGGSTWLRRQLWPRDPP